MKKISFNTQFGKLAKNALGYIEKTMWDIEQFACIDELDEPISADDYPDFHYYCDKTGWIYPVIYKIQKSTTATRSTILVYGQNINDSATVTVQL